MRNDSDNDFILARHTLVGFVESFDERDAYLVNEYTEAALVKFDDQLDGEGPPDDIVDSLLH